MVEEYKSNAHEHCGEKKIHTGGMCGGTYGLAFLGAAIYFIQHATSFWDGVLGILKALVWPAVIVYKILEFLKL